ncbi:MAG: NAD-dependent succinate-semialdehyde dehydrogenase [Candidatus Aegiribacteria sp.]|nr:NAD-dependent succinate-semialdehyde dehydrogenase [Candidatus Aegiribacteria sp.]
MLQSINPFTGKVIRTWDGNSPDEVENIIEKADGAFRIWRDTDMDKRAERLRNLAYLLESGKHQLAVEMASEMGKPVIQGQSEIEKCAWVCRYYAEYGPGLLAEEIRKTDADKSYVCYQPLGVIFAIMPWNFPFWQFFRFAAPAVMAGNTFVLKHSPNVTGCALSIQELFSNAGFQDGLAGLLFIPEENIPEVSSSVIADDRIKAVTLTGSGRAGGSVASVAGSAIKKCVLELGGSDPAIILEDADLKNAAAESAFSRLINAGQNCIASKRFIVIESVYDEFLELLVNEMEIKRMGDPMRMEVDLGPMARYDLRDNLHRQVTESIDLGAELITGGEIPDHPGAFYPPTVLTACRKGMPVFNEETFGPVAAVCSVKNEGEAVRLANDTSYGLGASVYTRDTRRGEKIALELNAGVCFVNTFVRSDPRLPFGGIGLSGFGRELYRNGMLEFANCKTVYIMNG